MKINIPPSDATSGIASLQRSLYDFISHHVDLNDFKKFNLPYKIHKLLLKTDSKIASRNLPFNQISLTPEKSELVFEVKNEKYIFNEIFVYTTQEKFNPEDDMHNILVSALYMATESDQVDANTIRTHMLHFTLVNMESSFEDDKYLEPIRDKVRTFICSFLDLINDREVTYSLFRASEAKRKRAARQNRIINDKVLINVKGELKKYLDSIDSDIFNDTHQYWVKGHFRYYNSNFYKDYQGKTKWIYPYIRGKGQLIDKSYHIK